MVVVKSKSRSDRTRLEGLNEVTARDTTWTRRVRLFQANDTRGGATHFGPSAAMMMVKSKSRSGRTRLVGLNARSRCARHDASRSSFNVSCQWHASRPVAPGADQRARIGLIIGVVTCSLALNLALGAIALGQLQSKPIQCRVAGGMYPHPPRLEVVFRATVGGW